MNNGNKFEEISMRNISEYFGLKIDCEEQHRGVHFGPNLIRCFRSMRDGRVSKRPIRAAR